MRPVSSRILRHLGTTTFSRPQSYLSRSLHPSITKLAMELEAGAAEAPNMEQAPDYTSWSHEQLIERVTKLEKELKITNQRSVCPSNAPRHDYLHVEQPGSGLPEDGNMPKTSCTPGIRPKQVQ